MIVQSARVPRKKSTAVNTMFFGSEILLTGIAASKFVATCPDDLSVIC